MLNRAYKLYRPVDELPSDEDVLEAAEVWADEFAREGVPAERVMHLFNTARERRRANGGSIGFIPTIDDLMSVWDSMQPSESDQRAAARYQATQLEMDSHYPGGRADRIACYAAKAAAAQLPTPTTEDLKRGRELAEQALVNGRKWSELLPGDAFLNRRISLPPDGPRKEPLTPRQSLEQQQQRVLANTDLSPEARQELVAAFARQLAALDERPVSSEEIHQASEGSDGQDN